MIIVKDIINVHSSNLDLIINEEYLHCSVKDKIELKIQLKIVFNGLKYVFNKIHEQKKNR